MSEKRIDARYEMEPTPALFHADDSFFRCLQGPYGSGKTTACLWEIILKGMNQAPMTVNGREGVRPTRWAIVRNTFGVLKTTTIKSWRETFPEAWCQIKMSPPIELTIEIPMPDHTTAVLEIHFVAMDQVKDLRRALSLQLTGVFFNEVREIPRLLVQALIDRTGRFPPEKWGPITWKGAIADTNPPDDDHWLYHWAEHGKWEDSELSMDVDDERVAAIEKSLRSMTAQSEDGSRAAYSEMQIKTVVSFMKSLKTKKDQFTYKFFKQPGGLIQDEKGRYLPNPLAENIRHLDGGHMYYFRMIQNRDPEYVKVYAMGQYGTTFDGRAVYENVWNDREHVAKHPIDAMAGVPIRLGFDFGSTPACVVCQLTPMGQMRVLREFLCTKGSLREFLREQVVPALRNFYPGFQIIVTGDPAGWTPDQNSGSDAGKELAAAGIPGVKAPVPGNRFEYRRQAVTSFMTRRIGDQPGLLVSPLASTLRRAHNGGYRFKRIQSRTTNGAFEYRDTPEKNHPWSDIADALQYACAHADGTLAGMFEPRGVRRVSAMATPTQGWEGFV